RFRIADRFMTAHYRVDGCFAFRLQTGDAGSCIGKFTSKLLGFESLFSVLTGGTIALAREAFGLLEETLERGFELARDLAQTFGDCGLRQYSARSRLDLAFRGAASGKPFSVRFFRSS